MTNLSMSKRFLMMFIAAWITFISVFGAYQQTTQAAEWVAGTVAAVGGAPLLTALVIGGVVVAGGVALYEFSQTDAEDWNNFGNGIKQGFEEFVAEQETEIIKQNNSNLSDEEAATQGVAIARDTVNGWWNSAVSGVRNTTNEIKFNAQSYWNLYSKIIGNVADNGISTDIGIGADTVIYPNIINNSGYSIGAVPNSNIGGNCISLGENYYLQKGTYCEDLSSTSGTVYEVNQNTISSDRIRVPFAMIWVQGNVIYHYLMGADINKLTGNIITFSNLAGPASYTQNGAENSIIKAIGMTSFPVLITTSYNAGTEYMMNNYMLLLPEYGGGSPAKNYENTINDILTNTRAGKSISTGRKQLVNEGDYIYSAFKENSIPIKKSSIKVNENTATGDIGWDIPSAGTYDDVFSGNKPYGQVVGQTGTIAVPDDVIVGANDPDYPIDNDTSIDFPKDTPVQDSADYPDSIPDDPAVPDDPAIPDKPFQDVIEEQGGTFYPTEMDITSLFPFCIPFDIIYLVNKFDAGGEQAPVITIPIIYPTAIQSAMGTDRYEVVIDFQDFIVVRNVLRVFILLLFIAGLMKVTRDLIRG